MGDTAVEMKGCQSPNSYADDPSGRCQTYVTYVHASILV